MNTRLAFVIAAASAAAVSASATASVRITEVSPTASSTAGSDWFELTNFGGFAVDITGWKMDDNSFNIANAVALSGVTSIAPGESVLFIESAAGANVAAFRSWWGGLSTVQVGFYSGSGVGLSSGGDGVIVFDALNAPVEQVSFGAPVTPPPAISFGFNPSTLVFGAASVNGVNGAFLSTGGTPNDVGSPGLIPTPGAAALLALGALVGRRRR